MEAFSPCVSILGSLATRSSASASAGAAVAVRSARPSRTGGLRLGSSSYASVVVAVSFPFHSFLKYSGAVLVLGSVCSHPIRAAADSLRLLR
jgi:hypothetical protein